MSAPLIYQQQSARCVAVYAPSGLRCLMAAEHEGAHAFPTPGCPCGYSMLLIEPDTTKPAFGEPFWLCTKCGKSRSLLVNGSASWPAPPARSGPGPAGLPAAPSTRSGAGSASGGTAASTPPCGTPRTPAGCATAAASGCGGCTRERTQPYRARFRVQTRR